MTGFLSFFGPLILVLSRPLIRLPSRPHFRPLVGTLAALLLMAVLCLQASGMPGTTASWSEEPWVSEGSQVAEAKESTLSDPITTNSSCLDLAHTLSTSSFTPSPNLASTPNLTPNLTPIPNSSSTNSAALGPESSCESGSWGLWVSENGSLFGYAQVVLGEDVTIFAHTQKDGNADIYLISYSNGSIQHWSYGFLKEYCYRLTLVPQEQGRLFLIMVQGNAAGSPLILDVSPAQDGSSQSMAPNLADIRIGEAMVTVRSERIQGYDVYVDGVFFSSDASDGAIDGSASFTVGGGKSHTIIVSQRNSIGNTVNRSEHTRNFERDVAYTLWLS